MSATTLDGSMRPNHRIVSKTKHPIIVVLDVTGSNIDTARIVYDKFPMFSGQIEQQGYLDEFDICLIAVGDANYDDYPLQVGEFAVGIENDTWLKKIVLEGGGGPYGEESYELACSYLANFFDMPEGAEPIIFFQADEKPYAMPILKKDVESAGMEWKPEVSDQDAWKVLREKCKDNVFLLQSGCEIKEFPTKETKTWETIINPDHIIPVGEEKAIIDLMLGVIAMVFESRDMESYKVDMLDKGQTAKRIATVESSLKNLSTSLAVINANADLAAVKATNKTTSKGKRL